MEVVGWNLVWCQSEQICGLQKYNPNPNIVKRREIAFRNHLNNTEDPDPVRRGTGSSVMYTKNVYRENRSSL